MEFKEITFKGKYILKTDLVVLTGLHIGTAGNSLEIGGVDNCVIKDAFGKPYLPGSSLKGKLRSLMEFYHNKLTPEETIYVKKGDDKQEQSIRMHMCNNHDCCVCNLFGRNHGKHEYVKKDNIQTENNGIINVTYPTRLLVRDALIEEKSITDEMRQYMDLDFTEVKFENNIDRITSAANPRQTERVPAGARFNCEFILNIYDDDSQKYLQQLILALRLLQDDYLGGNGSRGYGKVKFENIKLSLRDLNYYFEKQQEKILEFEKLEDVEFDKLVYFKV